MTKRMLSDRANEVAGHLIAELNGLPLHDGLSILISILAATLNGQAGDAADAEMLWQAACHDLLTTMREGCEGILTEGRIQ
ncbi:MAG: hypothetical protein K8H74_17990 [Notoacmeibacter sp.]|nr:hypothetical protein [Notoacmeibacter sp.]